MSVCEGCNNQTNILKGSFFSKQMLCQWCLEIEENSPLYTIAVEIEQAHVIKGNTSFEGIGTKWVLCTRNTPNELILASVRYLSQKHNVIGCVSISKLMMFYEFGDEIRSDIEEVYFDLLTKQEKMIDQLKSLNQISHTIDATGNVIISLKAQ